ncbi:hypothetical protein [Methanobacterium paludis]|uniref:Uncharacterized protein n=1 Tax=Methanobacterium paludis (strain DSM 25820 / JCM 18151 / SWAN1) TaxID=868131 RepID=F6D1N4_METPW|nr:hypothetical protein [Methanobacterium paludis]AEG17837.1 hypothetical protein MSWAN_0809 [Methanobacterium paludis]
MKTWIVRAVDWGNIQRGPTFQAIFNYFFSDSNNLPLPVVFDSAGTQVDAILRDSTPVTKKLDIIDAGITYDILKGGHKRLADDFLSNWYGKSDAHIPDKEKKRITQLYSEIKTDVHLLQMGFRNEALLDAGIPEQYLPGMRVPFRHDENLRLIIPVEESIAQKVEDYYQPFKDKKPITKIYSNLVGINPLKDELTGGIETAKKQVKYFMDTREKAIDEIIRLFPTV